MSSLMTGVTFDAKTRAIDVLIVCEDWREQRHMKEMYPYAFVAAKNYPLHGLRASTIWVSPRIDQRSRWYQELVLTRIVAGGVITTMDPSEY